MPAQSKPSIAMRGAVLAALALVFGPLSAGCGVINGVAESLRHPPKPFAQTPAPPAPDYAEAKAWLAYPGRNGLERSTPAGFTAVDEANAPADVFFIHPTTYLKNDVWNAAYDVDAPYNVPVLLNQISAFNGCCRLYAPHYRQASLQSLDKSPPAVDLAYGDIVRAFRQYIAHDNHGRPFIIASHSQGTMHAVRLLQDQILGTPLQKQLVAAYVIGAYAPSNFAEAGLPICDSAAQTGCVVSWNTTESGRDGANMLIHDKRYWWQGAFRQSGKLAAVCVNPLTWTQQGSAPAAANAGAMPFPEAPYPKAAATLPALAPHLTGAVCKDQLLAVTVPDSPKGFHDTLSLVYGSYHRVDYGLFYGAIHANAIDRVAAWTAAQAPGGKR